MTERSQIQGNLKTDGKRSWGADCSACLKNNSSNKFTKAKIDHLPKSV